jgi:hypothetical protein
MARTYFVDGQAVVIAPGWGISDKINARSTLAVTVIDAQSATIVEGAEFQMFNGAAKLFEGVILRVRKYEPYPNELHYSLETVDNSALADKRVVAKSYTSETAGDIVTDLITEVLTEESVTAGTIAAGVTISKAVFNYIKCSAALDYIKDVTGLNWNIDKDKQLQFFDRSTNAAPWVLDDSVQHSGFNQESTLDDYRNIQYVRGGRGRTSAQNEETPTPAPDGKSRNFVLRFPIAEQPTIEINLNGAGWVAVDPADIGINGLNTNKKWYWSYASQIISQDESEAVLVSADAIRVTYTGLRNLFLKLENLGEIEQNGKYEVLNTEKSISTSKQCEEYAQGLIEKYGEIKDIITFKTEVVGLEAGQLLTVNKPLYGINDTFLIESVNISAPDSGSIEYSVRALDGASIGGWEEFFKELLKGNRDYAINENEVILLINNQTESEGYEGSIEVDVFNALYPQTDNLVLNGALNVDTDSDGKADYWILGAAGGAVASFTIDNNSQRIDLTSTSGGNQTSYAYQEVLGINAGDTINVTQECDFTELTGTARAKNLISFRTSAGAILGYAFSNILYSTVVGATLSVVDAIAPALTKKMRIEFQVQSDTGAGTGIGWFRDIVVQRDGDIPLYPANDLYPNTAVASEVTVND